MATVARVTPAPPELPPDTILRLAPDLRVRVDPGGHVLVDAPSGNVVDAGPDGLAVLEAFRRPAALGTALADLPQPGIVTLLLEEGALVPPDGARGAASGWADPVEHARMLHDDARTGDYLRAIARVVRPGDVVLDVGTGSGVLAVAAARAGARRVYAVEGSAIGEVAERVVAANGVEDRVTVVRGWSRQVELPEPADVLVAEIIGSEPLEEDVLETTLDARRRLLAPDARLVPRRLSLLARPLRVPEAAAREFVFGAAAVERWRALYDMDFTALLDAASPVPLHAPVAGEDVARWPAAGPLAVLAAIDLGAFAEPSVDAAADLAVRGEEPVNAVAVTFRAELADGVVHELDPWRRAPSSWATSVWMLPEPIAVPPGAALRVRYRRRAPGGPDGLRCEVAPRSDGLGEDGAAASD